MFRYRIAQPRYTNRIRAAASIGSFLFTLACIFLTFVPVFSVLLRVIIAVSGVAVLIAVSYALRQTMALGTLTLDSEGILLERSTGESLRIPFAEIVSVTITDGIGLFVFSRSLSKTKIMKLHTRADEEIIVQFEKLDDSFMKLHAYFTAAARQSDFVFEVMGGGQSIYGVNLDRKLQ